MSRMAPVSSREPTEIRNALLVPESLGRCRGLDAFGRSAADRPRPLRRRQV